MRDPDDPPLRIEEFIAGDARAFAEVIHAFTPLVRAIASRHWTGVFECEEAMQEVWLHVFQNRASFDPARTSSFPGWLSIVARRRCIELLRRAGRTPPVVSVDDLEDLCAPSAEPLVPFEHAELARELASFAERLRPTWRRFFELHFLDGFGYREVARRMSISVIRCKYMKKVLVLRLRRNRALVEFLRPRGGGTDAL